MQGLGVSKFKLVLLEARGVLGNLAAGFLVSAPAQLVLRETQVTDLLSSIAFGIVFLVAMALLVPFTSLDWCSVALPAFKRYELAVSFFSMVAAGVLQPLPFLLPALKEKGPVFWLVFVLMAFGWGLNKANSVIFRDFYCAAEKTEPKKDE